jgi:NAD(P)-dependent dehydrogenase (short-subunit alcohol dehydrogenase family)
MIAKLFSLSGRTAIVTGASSGLGEAIARTIAHAGARVAVVARRADRLESLAHDIGAYPIESDLLDPASAARIVAATAEALGPPELLFNVAGSIAGVHPAEEESRASIESTLALNLIAPYQLCQEVLPHMLRVGRGAILNVASISGLVGIGVIPQASYAASKRGLSGLTAELAVQWARHSIRVNALAAGFFKSEMTSEMYDDERTASWLRRNTLLPYEGEPADFVGAALWLTSDAGRYVTGQTIVVDGGWTAR